VLAAVHGIGCQGKVLPGMEKSGGSNL